MMLVNKETDYAVRAAAHLARADSGYVSIRDIARREKIPYQFLRRIVKKLADGGIVRSKEGKSGGVKLAKAPEKIRVLDIMRICRGDVRLVSCMFRKRLCGNRKTCVLRRKISAIEGKVIREFGKITIAGLVRNTGGKDEKKDHKDRRRKV